MIVGLIVLAVTPTQPMAGTAGKQPEVVASGQPGNFEPGLAGLAPGQRVCMAGVADGEVVSGQDGRPDGLFAFVAHNWAELLLALMALVKVVVRLTPSIKDDKVFGWLDDLVSAIVPNYEKKA